MAFKKTRAKRDEAAPPAAGRSHETLAEIKRSQAIVALAWFRTKQGAPRVAGTTARTIRVHAARAVRGEAGAHSELQSVGNPSFAPARGSRDPSHGVPEDS